MQTSAAKAVDEQIQASQSAAQTARQAADAYRQTTASLADAVRQLRGGDLSPLLPKQKLDEARAQLDAVYNTASTGDAAALAALPQIATDFLTASRTYNASSQAYTDDFAHVMDLLAQAGVASDAAAARQDYAATLADAQVAVLTQIKAELARTDPNTDILRSQLASLNSLSTLNQAQLAQLIVANDPTADTYSATVRLLQQLVDLTAQKTAQDQAAAPAPPPPAPAAEQQAAADRANAQQSAQATAAYQAQKAISDANLAAFRGYVSTMPGGEHVANANEDIAANAPFSYQYFEAYVGQEAAAFAQARALQAQYMDAFSAAYDLYKAIPGHAGGLAYVPHDDYLMRAHQGEIVMDAGISDALRRYGIKVGADITKADLDALLKSIETTNTILQALAAASSKDVREQTEQLAAAVEESAQTIGRTVARAAEAGTRA